MSDFTPTSWLAVEAISLIVAGPILLFRAISCSRVEVEGRSPIRSVLRIWGQSIFRYFATTTVGYWIIALVYVVIMNALGIRDYSMLEGSGMEGTALRIWFGLIGVLCMAALIAAWRGCPSGSPERASDPPAGADSRLVPEKTTEED